MANTGDTIEIAVANETRASSVAWGAVIAGAVSAAVLSLILGLLGAALGFAVASPWSSAGEIATTLAVGTVIWLIVMQWLSAGLGGFVTGRLRVRWSATGDEVFFRDTVHGFLSWALATLIVVGVAGSTVSAVVGTGVQAVGSAAGGAVEGAAGSAGSSMLPTAYFVDTLFRPADVESSADAGEVDSPAATEPAATTVTAPALSAEDSTTGAGVAQTSPSAPVPAAAAPAAEPAQQASSGGDAVRAETDRLLIAGFGAEEFPAEDQAYLARLVASEAGVSQEEAEARVDAVLARAEALKTQAVETADAARKVAAQMSLFLFLSLLIGAFIASVAAALGGSMRDDPSQTVAR